MATKINYLLPISVSKEPYDLKLPPYIIQSFALALVAGWRSKKLSLMKGFPPVKIGLEYRDIGGKIFKKDILLILRFTSATDIQFGAAIEIEESQN